VSSANSGNYQVIVTSPYGSVTSSVATLTVAGTVPLLSWTNPAPLTFGTPLSSAQLNASANVPGSFIYSPTNGAVLPTGTNLLSVLFTPTDTNDYTTATAQVSLVVNPALPILAWTNPAPTTYGTTLSANQLNATANIPGSFSYSPAIGAVLPAGTNLLSALFIPADTNDYTAATASVILNVGQATPVLAWPAPAPIPYGAPLGPTQLNATASVPGTFAYSPANGTVLPAGTNLLSVVFTPSDTNDYTTATASVDLTVLPPSTQSVSIVMSPPTVTGGTLLLGFTLIQGSTTSFTLLQTPDLTQPWTTNTAAVLTTNALSGGYQFSLPAPGSTAFYQVRSP
jgi:hypothetical protein